MWNSCSILVSIKKYITWVFFEWSEYSTQNVRLFDKLLLRNLHSIHIHQYQIILFVSNTIKLYFKTTVVLSVQFFQNDIVTTIRQNKNGCYAKINVRL